MYIYQVERDLLNEAVAKHAHYISGKIIDIGSGLNKRYAKYFKKAVQYLTLDINPDNKPDIIGSAEAIPVGENSFDGVVCTQVLGDILHPENAIKEFYRILKPGGTVLLTEGFMNELHGEPIDYWRFTPFGLKALFEENDFEILTIEMLGGGLSVVSQMFTRYLINSFSLYEHKILGRIFSKLFFIFGKAAIWFDDKMNNSANKKVGLNILVIAKKCLKI